MSIVYFNRLFLIHFLLIIIHLITIVIIISKITQIIKLFLTSKISILIKATNNHNNNRINNSKINIQIIIFFKKIKKNHKKKIKDKKTLKKRMKVLVIIGKIMETIFSNKKISFFSHFNSTSSKFNEIFYYWSI